MQPDKPAVTIPVHCVICQRWAVFGGPDLDAALARMEKNNWRRAWYYGEKGDFCPACQQHAHTESGIGGGQGRSGEAIEASVKEWLLITAIVCVAAALVFCISWAMR